MGLLDGFVRNAERLCEGNFVIWGTEGGSVRCVCSLFSSLFAVLWLTLYHGSATVRVYKGVPFPISLC